MSAVDVVAPERQQSLATVFICQPRAVSDDTPAIGGRAEMVGDIAGKAKGANGVLIRYRKRSVIDLVATGGHTVSTKLSITFLLPAFSKATSSLWPSIATMQP